MKYNVIPSKLPSISDLNATTHANPYNTQQYQNTPHHTNDPNSHFIIIAETLQRPKILHPPTHKAKLLPFHIENAGKPISREKEPQQKICNKEKNNNRTKSKPRTGPNKHQTPKLRH